MSKKWKNENHLYPAAFDRKTGKMDIGVSNTREYEQKNIQVLWRDTGGLRGIAITPRTARMLAKQINRCLDERK